MKRWVLLLIIALATALRLYQLGDAQLWYDEAYSALVMRLPLPQMMQVIAGDVHPPLFYLLYRPIIWVSSSEWLLRLPSCLLSIAAVWLTYVLGVRLLRDERAALAGMLIMALAPTQVHYASEMRMYALLQVLALLAVLALISSRWVWLGVCNLALIYTHNYGLLFVAVLGLAWLIGSHRQYMTGNVRWAWLRLLLVEQLIPAFVIPGLLYLPWLFVLAGQMQTVAGGYWIQPVTPGAVIYSMYMLWGSFSTPARWQAIAVIVYFAAMTWATVRLIQFKPAGWALLLIVGYLPLAVAVVASLAWRPILLFRGLIVSVPALYLMVGWALSRVRPTYQAVGAGALALTMIVGLYGHYSYNVFNKSDVVTYINQVRSNWHDGDVIAHINDGSMISWTWYAPDLQQIRVQQPGCSNPLGSLSSKSRAGFAWPVVEPDDLTGRVWLVWSEGPTSYQCEDEWANDLLGEAELYQMVFQDKYRYAGVWKLERRDK